MQRGAVPPRPLWPCILDYLGEIREDKAVQKHNAEVVQLLLAFGADPNSKNEFGLTALHWAVDPGRTGVLRWVLATGVDSNSKTINGDTPLHCAASNGWVEVSLLLLDVRADLNSKNEDG